MESHRARIRELERTQDKLTGQEQTEQTARDLEAIRVTLRQAREELEQEVARQRRRAQADG